MNYQIAQELDIQFDMNPLHFVTLHLYAPRAYKTYTLQNSFIVDNKIHIKSLIKQLKIKSLNYINDITDKKQDVLLQYDDKGWSILNTFEAGKTYKIRKGDNDDFDESIEFSDAKMETVEKHFKLSASITNISKDNIIKINILNVLFDTLNLLSSKNTLLCEYSRRTIISLYLLYALDKFDTEKKLFIHEEMNFSCIRDEFFMYKI